jgi:cell division protein FtsN
MSAMEKMSMDPVAAAPAAGKSKLPIIIGVIVIIVIAVFAARMKSGKKMGADVKPGSPEAQAQVKTTVEKVGKLMVLPSGEEPTVAIVNNAENLKKEQPFYANVENGDYLVVYPKAAKAIIYRESSNVLVNVGPLQVVGNLAPAGTTPAK